MQCPDAEAGRERREVWVAASFETVTTTLYSSPASPTIHTVRIAHSAYHRRSVHVLSGRPVQGIVGRDEELPQHAALARAEPRAGAGSSRRR